MILPDWKLLSEPILRGRRTLPSFASEEEHASLGAIAARHGPSSIFALQRQARLEAQKTYVHVDCSRRVQKALLRDAVPFDREFSVGDLVTFRRSERRYIMVHCLPGYQT